ncbi:MAG: hypothetical protein J4F46_04220 [Dehalococcoidia bacterium]|nr:hypothetical protein [Dehalococcoidia bacterium]
MLDFNSWVLVLPVGVIAVPMIFALLVIIIGAVLEWFERPRSPGQKEWSVRHAARDAERWRKNYPWRALTMGSRRNLYILILAAKLMWGDCDWGEGGVMEAEQGESFEREEP